MIDYLHMKFIDVTNNMDKKYIAQGYKAYDCYNGGQFLGCIGWDNDIEQYVFVNTIDENINFSYLMLNTIENMVFDLMKERFLN